MHERGNTVIESVGVTETVIETARGDELVRIQRDVTRSSAPPPKPNTATPRGRGPVPPTLAELERERTYFVENLAGIRQLLQRAGTALGTAAAALVGGLGYATLHDLFPLPANQAWVGWLALVSVAAGLGGSIWLAARFFAAQRRIIISPSTPWRDIEQKQFTEAELEHIREVYRCYVDRYAPTATGGSSARDDLGRVQAYCDALRDSGEEALAERVAAVVRVAELDAVMSVLEHRSSGAFGDLKSGGWRSIAALALAAVGIIGTFALADYSKSERPSPPPAVQAIDGAGSAG